MSMQKHQSVLRFYYQTSYNKDNWDLIKEMLENGFIEGTELRVILDLNVDEGKIRIGMGAGPTYSETEI